MNIKTTVSPEVKRKIFIDFFKDSPVRLDLKREGQSVDDGVVSIGPIAGPDSCWTNLIHEMAHLVEIDIARVNQYGWGLRYGKYWEMFGRSGHEPQTDQQVRREERVWAFQLNLQAEYGVHIDELEMVSSAVYLPAFCYVKIGINDQDRLKIIADRVRKNREEFTMEVFRYEWRRRMEYLRGVKK